MTNKQKVFSGIGGIGTLLCIVLFIAQPSFPTPDKLLVFAIFVGMFFRQGKQVFLRLAPFVAMLLAYESFRGLVPHMTERANFMWMPGVDRILTGGGELPTKILQNWWWQGSAQWWDFMFYLPYMLHFVLPFGLAVIVWKTREKEYWRYVTAFVGASLLAFLVFFVFPAAPPWMASDTGAIEQISRISSSVWFALGINDFPSLYNQVSPNPVAAVPSLHAAYATMFALFVTMFFKSKWRFVAWIYPVLIYVGTVYQGEHYVIDEVLGALLGLFAFWASPLVSQKIGIALNIVKAKVLALKNQQISG